MLNRSKLWAAGLLAAAFVAGTAVGAAVTATWDRRDAAAESRRHERDDRGRQGGYAERLEASLGLTPEQRLAVDSILDRQQTAMRSLWAEYSPKFDELRQDVRNQIMEILDDEQQKTYRELIARSDRRRERESGTNDRR